MATTTYELTARYMLERPGGVARALIEARGHASKEARRSGGTPFWRYVVAHLEQLQDAPELDVVRCAASLTDMGRTEDGAVIVGPVGWAQLQDALAALKALNERQP